MEGAAVSTYQQAMADLDEAKAIIDALIGALEGVEPSDFMLSFGAVRMAWDLRTERDFLLLAATKDKVQ